MVRLRTFSKRLLQAATLLCFGPLIALYYCVLKCRLWQEYRRVRADNNKDVESGNAFNDKYTYLKYAIPSFIKQVTFGNFSQVLKLGGRGDGVNVIPTDVLYQALFNTSISLHLVRDKRRDIQWKLSFDVSKENWDRYDVTEVLIHKSGSLAIVDRIGRIHTSRDRSWSLAKAHVQGSMDFHKATDHFIPPQFIMPLFNQTTAIKMREECRSIKTKAVSLPNDLQPEIAYHAFIKEYYNLIKDFVAAVEPYIKDDYAKIKDYLKTTFTKSDWTNDVESLATMIWQSSILYCCNTASFRTQWADSYACVKVREPLVANGNTKSATNNNIESTVQDKQLINTHESYKIGIRPFLETDVCKTRCFLNTYLNCNPIGSVDVSLLKARYNFLEEELNAHVTNFVAKMSDLNSRLKQRGEAIVDVNNIMSSFCI